MFKMIQCILSPSLPVQRVGLTRRLFMIPLARLLRFNQQVFLPRRPPLRAYHYRLVTQYSSRGHSHTPLLCRYAFSRLSNRFCNRKKCFPTSWVVASNIHVYLRSCNSHKSQSIVAQKNANTCSHLRTTDLERD